MKSKRGSTSVFLSVILTSLILLCLAMIMGAREQSVNSRADAVLQLAGDSLLSEFDRKILTDYGLFLLNSDTSYLSSRFASYAAFSLDPMKDAELTGVKVSADRFLATDPAPLRKQIIAYMKSGGADLLLKEVTGADAGSNDSSAEDSSAADAAADTGSGTGGSGSGSEEAPGGTGCRTLRHGPTIASLPSRQLPEAGVSAILGKADRLKDLSSIFRQGTESYLLQSYALGMFRNYRDTGPGDHFFHNETEYILYGGLSDEENENKTTSALRKLRFPSNLAHIMADADKRSAAAAAGEAIVPGPAGSAISAVIITAWAWAESCNDAALLKAGYKVPAVKDGASWALDVDSVVGNMAKSVLDPARYLPENGEAASAPDTDEPESLLRSTGRMIRPPENKGLTYEQYLRILLFLGDDDLTVMRIMDLIQINMRKDVDRTFLICEQCTGLALEAEVNGRKFSYEKTY